MGWAGGKWKTLNSWAQGTLRSCCFERYHIETIKNAWLGSSSQSQPYLRTVQLPYTWRGRLSIVLTYSWSPNPIKPENNFSQPRILTTKVWSLRFPETPFFFITLSLNSTGRLSQLTDCVLKERLPSPFINWELVKQVVSKWLHKRHFQLHQLPSITFRASLTRLLDLESLPTFFAKGSSSPH